MKIEVVPNKKLWDMAKVIIQKQKDAIGIDTKKVMWDELEEMWFDWLDEEINGTDEDAKLV